MLVNKNEYEVHENASIPPRIAIIIYQSNER